ncbi:hypothetical protein GINT2_001145 [Glugoides intestinalis]
MTFIGFVKKLSTELCTNISFKNGLYWLNGKEVCYFELCGIVINISATTIACYDFFGRIEIQKKAELEIEDRKAFVVTVKPYIKNGKIILFCKLIRSVSFYEEMAFNIEVKALLESLCY